MNKILLAILLCILLSLSGCATKRNVDVEKEHILIDLLEETNLVDLDTYFWLGHIYVVTYLKRNSLQGDYDEVETIIRDFFMSEDYITSHNFYKHYNVYIVKNTIFKPKIMNSTKSRKSFSIVFNDCKTITSDENIELKPYLCVWQGSEILD
ncbi:hypothetical protein RI065_04655 [Mycoplasmatota bacterium zrk1]